jgi:hypothetical protein
MESIRRGSTYYDYENNINVIPKYLWSHSEMAAIMFAKEKSGEESIVKFFQASILKTLKNAWLRC